MSFIIFYSSPKAISTVCAFSLFTLCWIFPRMHHSLSLAHVHTRANSQTFPVLHTTRSSGGYEEQVCVCASSANSKFTTLYNWLCTRENMLANLWARARCISRPDSAHRGWNANSVRRSITI